MNGGPIGASWYMPSGRTHMIFAWFPKSKQEANNPQALSTPQQVQKALGHIFKMPEEHFQEGTTNLPSQCITNTPNIPSQYTLSTPP